MITPRKIVVMLPEINIYFKRKIRIQLLQMIIRTVNNVKCTIFLHRVI